MAGAGAGHWEVEVLKTGGGHDAYGQISIDHVCSPHQPRLANIKIIIRNDGKTDEHLLQFFSREKSFNLLKFVGEPKPLSLQRARTAEITFNLVPTAPVERAAELDMLDDMLQLPVKRQYFKESGKNGFDAVHESAM